MPARRYVLPWWETPFAMDTSTAPLFFTTTHADVIVESATGYGGGPALSGSSSSAYITALFAPPQSPIFRIGTIAQIDALPGSDTVLIGVVDEAGGTETVQVCAVLHSDGTISLRRGAPGDPDGAEIAMSATALTDTYALSTQLAIGLKGEISHSRGSVELWIGTADDSTTWAPFVRVNGEVRTEVSGRDVWLGPYFGFTADTHVSNLYAFEGDGDLRPGMAIDGYLPTSDVLTDWTPNTGTTVTGVTDDTVPDDDATYAESAAIGDRFAVGITSVTDRRVFVGVRMTALIKNGTGQVVTCAPLVVTGDGAVDVGNWRTVADSEYRVVDRADVATSSGEPFATADISSRAWGGETQA